MTADGSRALRLCVRVQEAGWLWSGGFALDTPGDLFIKIRCGVLAKGGWGVWERDGYVGMGWLVEWDSSY